MRKIIVILGIPIDDLDMPETLNRLVELVHAGRASGQGHQVVTVNADFVVKALRDPELRQTLQNADLATADGMPLVWGARLLKSPLRARVTGADLVPLLARRAEKEGFSIYLLGAAPGVADRAAEALKKQNPRLKICGISSPNIPSVDDTDPAILEDIRRAKPDILLVALGNPKQEKWMARFAPLLGVPVMIGVGGTLDFLAGKVSRAPLWMQNNGLEWFYRLVQEPRRLWKRYVVDLFVFSTFFLRQMWAMRKGWQPPTLLPTTELLLLQETSIIYLNGHVTVQNSETFRRWSRVALNASPYLIINLDDLKFLDSSAIGMLVGLNRETHELGGRLWLTGVRPEILSTFRLLRLDTFFTIRSDIDACLAERREMFTLQSSLSSRNGSHQPHLSRL